MYIHHIRLGFACNSSSNHSILLIDNEQTLNSLYDMWLSSTMSYGRQYFLIKSVPEKRRYLAAQIMNGIIDWFKEEDNAGWTGVYMFNLDKHQDKLDMIIDTMNELKLDLVYPSFKDDVIGGFGVIDHQSQYVFPVDHTGNLHWAFIADLRDFILRPDVVVHGSSTEEPNFFPSNAIRVLEDIKERTQRYTARRNVNKDGTFWYTFFNKMNGTKFSVSFNNVESQKTFVPDLVDLNITNYCAKHCNYCYKGSDKSGQHADMYDVERVAEYFGELGVFEVALGGGEPTTHPDFRNIVDEFHRHGVVPNFTTRNLKFLRLKNKHIWNKIGAIAYSIDGANDIKHVFNAIDVSRFGNTKNYNHYAIYGTRLPVLNFQYVCGTNTEHVLQDIINELIGVSDAHQMRLTLTLLGPKAVGRGTDYTFSGFIPTIEWLSSRIKGRISISVDTSMAELLDKDMQQHKHSWFFRSVVATIEGVNSMYVDLVDHTCARSSYTAQRTSLMINDYFHVYGIQEIFTAFNELMPTNNVVVTSDIEHVRELANLLVIDCRQQTSDVSLTCTYVTLSTYNVRIMDQPNAYDHDLYENVVYVVDSVIDIMNYVRFSTHDSKNYCIL